MKSILKIVKYILLTLMGIGISLGLLVWYFVYSPIPSAPALTGVVKRGEIQSGGLRRTYQLYVPRDLPKGAPLLFVMHGSVQAAAQIRGETGFGFDRLADTHGFAVVYPNSYTSDWNDCSRVGDFDVRGQEVDDVGFLRRLAERLVGEIGSDRHRIYATGVSSGGFMSLRLGLEAPNQFPAVAAVSANVPAPENFKCSPIPQAVSVLLMNGTKDPLVPFNGGEVSLLGALFKGGNVLSSIDSARYFVRHNGMTDTPQFSSPRSEQDVGVQQLAWHADNNFEVDLVVINGGGHGLPQAQFRRPRLLGPSPMAPDGPKIIWNFFERQTVHEGMATGIKP